MMSDRTARTASGEAIHYGVGQNRRGKWQAFIRFADPDRGGAASEALFPEEYDTDEAADAALRARVATFVPGWTRSVPAGSWR